jgi:hypothetical protein
MNNLFHAGKGTFILVVGSVYLYNGGYKNTFFKGNQIIGSKFLIGSIPFAYIGLDASPITFHFPSGVFRYCQIKTLLDNIVHVMRPSIDIMSYEMLSIL